MSTANVSRQLRNATPRSRPVWSWESNQSHTGSDWPCPRPSAAPQQRPRLPWIGLPADPSADKALVQTLAGRLATYVAHFVGTAGALSDGAAPPPALVEGYRIAMEVIAREWRVGTGPAGVIQVEEGSTAQREIFANVRENRYVLRQDGVTLRDAHELVEDPGVAATVIYRMAQSRALAGRVAPDAFYAPFAAGRFPPA